MKTPADTCSDLSRFVTAQDGIIERAMQELRTGRKQSHWMWFVFPQLRGLGRSETALHFGISGFAEARHFLADPLLGKRLIDATEAVLSIEDRTLHQIFGSPDDLKFRSSMTLFDAVSASGVEVFRRSIDRFCEGQADERTLELLQREAE